MSRVETSSKSLSILAVLCTFAASATCQAGILFDFNSLAEGISSTSSEDPISQYMEDIYGSEITIPLGTKTLKSKPENVGPTLYLGNSDNGVAHGWPKDTYLINKWQNGYDRITIIFEDVPINSVEFDWQIFPVTTGKADLTVKADGTTIFYYDNAGTQAEKEAGKMGHFAMTFLSPVSKLEFIDWTTAPIGIDNLYVTNTPPQQEPPVPEPAAMLIWGGFLGAGALVGAYRRRRQHAKQA